jgi:hypothetical protein
MAPTRGRIVSSSRPPGWNRGLVALARVCEEVRSAGSGRCCNRAQDQARGWSRRDFRHPTSLTSRGWTSLDTCFPPERQSWRPSVGLLPRTEHQQRRRRRRTAASAGRCRSRLGPRPPRRRGGATAAGSVGRSSSERGGDVVLAEPQRRGSQQAAIAAPSRPGSAEQQLVLPTRRCCSRPDPSVCGLSSARLLLFSGPLEPGYRKGDGAVALRRRMG